MTSYGSLLQPIYDVLEMIFPSVFMTDPFFSFIINLGLLFVSFCVFYMLFIWPIRIIIHSFRFKRGEL